MTKKWIYMFTQAESRASTTTLSYETEPVLDEWDFVCITVIDNRTQMVFRKQADD